MPNRVRILEIPESDRAVLERTWFVVVRALRPPVSSRDLPDVSVVRRGGAGQLQDFVNSIIEMTKLTDLAGSMETSPQNRELARAGVVSSGHRDTA